MRETITGKMRTLGIVLMFVFFSAAGPQTDEVLPEPGRMKKKASPEKKSQKQNTRPADQSQPDWWPGEKGSKTGEQKKEGEGTGSSFWENLFTMLAGLLVVLGLMFVVLWAMQKVTPGMGKFSSSGAVLVLTKSYLSKNHSIYVIKSLGRVLILGVTPDSIQTLTEITDPTEVSRIVSQYGPEEVGKWTPFKNFLRQEQEQATEEASRPGPINEINDELKSLRQRLDSLE